MRYTQSEKMEIIRMVEESSLGIKLKSYLEKQDIRHIRTRVYHPMTQAKIKLHLNISPKS